jgi:hypothetical protein
VVHEFVDQRAPVRGEATPVVVSQATEGFGQFLPLALRSDRRRSVRVRWRARSSRPSRCPRSRLPTLRPPRGLPLRFGPGLTGGPPLAGVRMFQCTVLQGVGERGCESAQELGLGVSVLLGMPDQLAHVLAR